MEYVNEEKKRYQSSRAERGKKHGLFKQSKVCSYLPESQRRQCIQEHNFAKSVHVIGLSIHTSKGGHQVTWYTHTMTHSACRCFLCFFCSIFLLFNETILQDHWKMLTNNIQNITTPCTKILKIYMFHYEITSKTTMRCSALSPGHHQNTMWRKTRGF